MIRAILLKVSLSVFGLGAVLFLTKAWQQDKQHESQSGSLAAEKLNSESKNIK